MTVGEFADAMGLTVLAGRAHLEREVTGGYCSDLLSDVMANAQEGDVWFTIQAHMNVVAVAVLVRVSAVVVTGGREVEQRVIERAEEKGLCLLATSKRTFDVAGALWALVPRRE